MFVHPATHHFSRTYTSQNAGHPTTSRKNLNKENAGALPSKTPSRMTAKGLVPSTSIRVGLGVKSTIKDGNVQNGGGGEGKGKGKDEDIAPKRLFTSHASSSKSTLPPSKSLSSLPAINSLPTRTPAARRQAPANLRTPAPPVFEPPTPLPSASRTRRRSRQSLTPLKADQTEFKTPARSAKWEEEVSLGSIEVGTELEELVEVDEGEGDDEVEYMPPPMPDLPPEPPFEHADLKRAFGILANVPPLWRFGEAVIEVPELVPDFEPEQDVQLLDDDMLEEPLFRIQKTDCAQIPAQPAASKTRNGLPSRNPSTTIRRDARSLLSSKPAASRGPLTTAALARTLPKTDAKPPVSSVSRPGVAIVKKPAAPAARSTVTRPASGATRTAPMSSARPVPTAVRVPQTAYLSKPAPATGPPATLKPLTSRGAHAIAAPVRGLSGRPPVSKADARPIIKIDVPVLELEDEPPIEADIEFDLSLGSDDEAGDVAGGGGAGADEPARQLDLQLYVGDEQERLEQ